MKKVLLSLSMLAAVMTANAQSVGIGAYDDFTTQTGEGNLSGEYSTQFVDANEVTQTAGMFWYTDADFASTYVKTRTGGQMTIAVNKDAEYSVVGMGFGDDNGSAPDGNPFYIDITNAKTFSCKVKATVAVQVRVQFEDANGIKIEGTAAVYGSEYSLNATTAFQTWTQNLAGGVGFQHSGCPSTNPCAITGFDYTKVAKVNFLISGGTAYAGTVTFDDFKLGTVPNLGLGTSSAAANIASTKVFPNPATSAFTAEIVLKNNANVTVILSDMMGKQLSTKTVANGSASFETAGLANGMYTVTYVVDGTPAKTELVVVK